MKKKRRKLRKSRMRRERKKKIIVRRDTLHETDKDLKKHITTSPPEKVDMPVKREPNVPLWESEWREGEEAMRQANKRLGALFERNRSAAPEQDHTE